MTRARTQQNGHEHAYARHPNDHCPNRRCSLGVTLTEPQASTDCDSG